MYILCMLQVNVFLTPALKLVFPLNKSSLNEGVHFVYELDYFRHTSVTKYLQAILGFHGGQ
jgi:hypothetical protein